MRFRIALALALALLLAATLPVSAQVTAESAVKGNLAGVVLDPTGAVIPGAKVTVVGPTGETNVETNEEGRFLVATVLPGSYRVKVEKEGFKATEVPGVQVVVGKTSTIRVSLQPGAVTETVEVTAAAVAVDTTSAAVGANLPDNFYENVPVGRNVTSLFYVAPGVTNGIGTGEANPSISGGTGLENIYVADGVQINDAAFGGFGVYSRNFGSLGSGVNLSFVKEVQVKTAGYEPQYGKGTGGIVQIVTKSGSRDYHGAIAAFAQPSDFEANRTSPDDFARINTFGKRLHKEGWDFSGELGGYVPGFRDHLFFFGSFNPSWQISENLSPEGNALRALLGPFERHAFSKNYAGKLTWKANDSHTFEGSVFGDPTDTNSTLWRFPNFFTADSITSFSSLRYGSRNVVGRWNGTLSPTWLANFSVSWNHNDFDELPSFPDVYQISDRTQTAGLPGQRGVFTAQGIGFLENYKSDNYAYNFDTSKIVQFGGEHTFSVGYRYERPNYDNIRDRTGPRFSIPATNLDGADLGLGANAGQMANAQLRLRSLDTADPVFGGTTCTVCPLLDVPGIGPEHVGLQLIRSEFGESVSETFGRNHTAYVNDSWSVNKYVTLNLGLRWEQARIAGNTIQYTFVDSWSPRLGFTVDPWGDRRSKVFGGFNRLHYNLPLDLAIRSLSNEQDLNNMWFAPLDADNDGFADIGPFGSVIPAFDAAHTLNNAAGSGLNFLPSVSVQAGQGLEHGTKQMYADEWTVGFERDMGAGVIVTARYVDRRLKRIVEDIGGQSPEGAISGLNHIFLITNVDANTDLFVNPNPQVFPVGTFTDVNNDGSITSADLPAACGGTPFFSSVQGVGASPVADICFPETSPGSGLFGGEQQADGLPDGFPKPIRNYQAVEIEVNKAFSKGWQMRANYRWARLRGNYEGAFRNDNSQSDPGITSLLDFTEGVLGLLGDQFAVGPLNTDRTHTVNGFFSYTFSDTALKGLTVGSGVRVQSGFPVSQFFAHPVYGNGGEVPVGGRGSLGRTPVIFPVDVHVDYALPITEGSRLHFGADLFNIGNTKRLLLPDQNRENGFGEPNLDFGKPGDPNALGADSFNDPFRARLSIKYEF